ncbi:hypothetical protein F5877DRAFT_85169 [Lentinula edodes]|nr:hypothetical protein F5877DRAFT_85169 [Lentinula edodes]
MPPTARHIPPVAEREIPPLPMYALLAQNDMAQPEFRPLLAQSDLRNRPNHPARAKRPHPYARNRHLSPAPTIPSSAKMVPDPETVLNSESDNEHEILQQVQLMGRPKDSSRLTLAELQSRIGWLDTPFNSIRARLAELVIKEKLAPICLSDQPKERVLKEYPELKMFHESWPFEVLLSRHLKNLSEKARKSAEPVASTSRRRTRETG